MDHNSALQFRDLPELTEIIINEIKSNIGSEISEKKLKEIISFVAAHNEMTTYKEYVNLLQMIIYECQKDNYDVLLILLGHEIEVDGIRYKINQQNKTASLFKIQIEKENVIIPRSITYESNEYIITSIVNDGFPSQKNVKSIQFDENSELHTIYSNSLCDSPIEKIFFPKNLTDLRDEALSLRYLKDIEISPLNKKFIYKDNKYLLGKSDINSDNYDILFFVRRDVSEFQIPSTVKIISSYAFSCTKIKTITIPPQVTAIKSYAFYFCNYLENIEIFENSELKEIGEFAFHSTQINSIFIPKNLTVLDALRSLDNLKKITVSPLSNNFFYKDNTYILKKSNINNNDFDTIAFARNDLKEIKIPSNIKIIGPKVFQYYKSKIFEIPVNSELERISNLSFFCSEITQIYIPQHVKIIDDYAFCRCTNLRHLEFAENSELQIIKKFAFIDTKVANIKIPNSVIKIGKFAFYSVKANSIDIQENSQLQSIGNYGLPLSEVKEIFIPKNLKIIKKGCFSASTLTKIKISPLNDRFKYKDDKYLLAKSDINNENYDVLLFARRDIQEAEISSSIKKIASHSFYNCDKLTKINIPENSELQIIENNAFEETNISEIYIPKNVIKIEKHAFNECKNLNVVEIPNDSKLELIEENAFNSTNITKIYIPQYVSHIYDKAFSYCRNLKIVNFHKNSELKTIGSDSFCGTHIHKIFIPEKVSLICDRAFFLCNKLHYVNFHQNSKLKSIGEYAFSNTKIRKIFIPKSVLQIGDNAFYQCDNLNAVEFGENSNLQSIDKCAFSQCSNLEFINFHENSELKSIGAYSFCFSKIKGIYIPEKVSLIGEKAFGNCSFLQIVEISQNSQLPSIDISIFYNSPQIRLMIPSTKRNIIESNY